MQITFWSRGAATRTAPELKTPQTISKPGEFPLEPAGRFYRAEAEFPAAGTLVLQIASPRPLRIWLDGEKLAHEPLEWRSFQRQVRAAVVVPVEAGRGELFVEVGPRPRHPEGVDRDCPSRNRERVLHFLETWFADVLQLAGEVKPGAPAPGLGLRFLPGQFHRDGVTYQEVVVRPLARLEPPSVQVRSLADIAPEAFALGTGVCPGKCHEATSDEERRAGLRHFYVPVATALEPLKPLRDAVLDIGRAEPCLLVARTVALSVEGGKASAAVEMPVYESLGRLAPRRDFRELSWPAPEAALAALPEPILPPEYAHFAKLYQETWRMLLRLVRHPRPESGLPNSYISTGAGFTFHQFVWDTSFTAMATAYGWRVLPAWASLDLLYSRQHDGGYIHRETDVRDGMPALYEPDFSPNPPLMAVAEWAIYRLSGDAHRLRQVYPALAEHHAWLEANRRLSDGTFWTTGLANGLDNSPSLGDGYPCLTAQMAHHADVLSQIAEAIGREGEARKWRARHAEIGRALNERLWSDSMRFYSTSLPGGGHNPNKVVTGFWPLWAGVVPAERVEALARQLKDPKSFWRHHPAPSLAADSPHFQFAGNYWLGSTWAPTNYATIKGFQRAGRLDLARETTLRHLQCMSETLEATGFIWENYCSEKSERGNWSGPNYCWSSLGPVALLFEVLIGLEPDAAQRRIRWTPPAGKRIGVRRYPLGPCTVQLLQFQGEGGADRVEVHTDFPFTLELCRDGKTKAVSCAAGRTEAAV